MSQRLQDRTVRTEVISRALLRMFSSFPAYTRVRNGVSILLVSVPAAFLIFMAAVACGGALPTGDPPFKLHWETSASEVNIGEIYTLTVRMYDVREAGEHGGLSVSFPLLTEADDSDGTYSSSMAEVEVADYTAGLARVTLYGPGETIYHRDDNRMFPAQNLLVESDDPSWSPFDDRTLELRITPRSIGEFPIWVRGWICASEYTDCARSPVDGAATDQQGYRAGVATIVVRESG